MITLTLSALILLWTFVSQAFGNQTAISPTFFSHLFAESVALYVLLRVSLSLPVIARFLPERTILELLIEVTTRVRKAWRRALAFRRLAINLLRLAHLQVLITWRQLRQRQCLHPPGLWSQSRAPLFLFQQAPLLSIP